MRPSLVAWLVGHGLPGWLAPDYFLLVAASVILSSMILLRRARLDGADVAREARTIAVAYVAALVGGYLFESLRMIPAAIAARSFVPMVHVGRAAYGGLLFAALAVWAQLRWTRRSVGVFGGGFFDRAAVPTGIVFAAVRTGCFLAGCDYGRPTASWLGVRFPARSLAAIDHATRGWIPVGAPSLPVHATELYEALVGLAASLVAWRVLRGGRRDGRAFVAWLACYAIGRFAVETLRGDADRGAWLGLSTAQWVSLGVLVAIAAGALVRRHLRAPAERSPSTATLFA